MYVFFNTTISGTIKECRNRVFNFSLPSPVGLGLTYQNGMTFYNTAAAAPATSIAPPTDPGTIYQAAGVFGKHYSLHMHSYSLEIVATKLKGFYEYLFIDIFINETFGR